MIMCFQSTQLVDNGLLTPLEATPVLHHPFICLSLPPVTTGLRIPTCTDGMYESALARGPPFSSHHGFGWPCQRRLSTAPCRTFNAVKRDRAAFLGMASKGKASWQ